MYSLYRQKCDSEKQQPSIPHREENKERLVKQYNKRVEGFVLGMMAKPIPVQVYRSRKNLSQTFRQSNKNTLPFRFAIAKDFIARQQGLGLPSTGKKSPEFRQRTVQKQIQPIMRFASRNSLDKVREKLNTGLRDQLARDQPELLSRQKYERITRTMSNTERKIFVAREIAKGMLPFLHRKTHFKAVQALLMKKEVRPVIKRQGDDFLPEQKLPEDMEEEKKVRKLKVVNPEAQQLLQCSRAVLMKCGLVRSRVDL